MTGRRKSPSTDLSSVHIQYTAAVAVLNGNSGFEMKAGRSGERALGRLWRLRAIPAKVRSGFASGIA
jgi:hypothetical protein